MEKKVENRRKDYTIPALFIVAVALVFVFSTISLIARRNSAPSVKNGATTSEVEEYAYKLLAADNGTSAIGYNEAIAYYNSQIAASSDKEQKFNLRLDFAIFFGETGDPVSGLQVLGDIDVDSIPLDARYYLYSTYIYLYERQGNEDLAAEYRQRIIDEGINEYFAGLDDGSIVPDPISDDATENDEEEYEEEPLEEDLFSDEGL